MTQKLLTLLVLSCCCMMIIFSSHHHVINGQQQQDESTPSNIPIIMDETSATTTPSIPPKQQQIIIGSENVKLSGKIMRQLITNSIMDHFQNVMFSPLTLGYSLSLILEACEKQDPKKTELLNLINKQFNMGDLKQAMQSIVEFHHETNMLNDEKARLILTPALFTTAEFMEKTSAGSDGAGFKNNVYVMKNLLIESSLNFTTGESADESRKLINRIISEKNNETTTALIGTGFVSNVTQAIYVDSSLFVGKWEKPFELNETTIELFRVISSSDEDVVEFIEIEMMNQHNSSFGYGEEKHYQWISLKFKDAPYSMIFIVPKDALSLYGDSEERFNRFVNRKLETGCLSCSFPTATEKFFKKVSIPKFRIESKSKLSKLLKSKSFGVSSLFPKIEKKKKALNSTLQTNETNTEVPPVVVVQSEQTQEEQSFWKFDEFFHKTILEISELGTVEGEITPESARLVEEREQDDSNFVLDRPFAFILQHEPTNTPVYVGKIAVL